MIFLSFPVMLIALIPIIFLEGYIYTLNFKTPFKKSLAASASANVLSTIAGFPLSWGLLLGLEFLTTGGSCGPGFDTLPNTILTAILESAWLCPWEDHLYWLIPIAFINSLIVAFFISVILELFVTKKFFRTIEKKIIRATIFKANLLSYLVLVIFGVGYLFYSISNYN